jgi:hypothetical protein
MGSVVLRNAGMYVPTTPHAHYNPENQHRHLHRRENPKSQVTQFSCLTNPHILEVIKLDGIVRNDAEHTSIYDLIQSWHDGSQNRFMHFRC